MLVDEVLAAGEAQFRKKRLGKMGEVSSEGRTVLFVGHNTPAIQQLCSRAILIFGGEILSDGPADAVVQAYLGDASTSGEGDFELFNHPARSPKHSPILRRLVLRSGDGACTTRFRPGDSLIADISVAPATRIHEPRLVLAIEDVLGRRITTVASFFQRSGLREIEAPCVIRCTLPRLDLGSGKYLLSLSINDRYSLLDSLHNAVWFEVLWNNNYRNGEPYLPVYGPVLWDSDWSLRADG